MNSQRRLIHAAAVMDGDGLHASPGGLLLERQRIIAAGSPETIGSSPDWTFENRPNQVLLPALVNSHCHLDLTHIGPLAFAGDFVSFVDQVRAKRARTDREIEESVKRGIELSRVGGTAIIGDIAGVGSTIPIQTMRSSRLAGVGFIEVFGVGCSQQRTIDYLAKTVESLEPLANGVQVGVQPHAPYSCGEQVYRAAFHMSLPLMTHLAETREELEFVRSASGPIAEMLKRFGVWDDSICAQGRHPVEYLLNLFGGRPMIAVHLNYIEPGDLDLLSSSETHVVYCPRASAYFGHPRTGWPPHQYRAMIERGINVSLGTDSIICLDTADRISILDEMRLLYRRDAAPPSMLIRMGTINGAKALGFDSNMVTFREGPICGVLGIETEPRAQLKPVEAALMNDTPPQWVFGPVPGEDGFRRGGELAGKDEVFST